MAIIADTAIIQIVSITPSIYGDKFGGITPFSKTTGSGKAIMLRDGFSYQLTWERELETDVREPCPVGQHSDTVSGFGAGCRNISTVLCRNSMEFLRLSKLIPENTGHFSQEMPGSRENSGGRLCDSELCT